LVCVAQSTGGPKTRCECAAVDSFDIFRKPETTRARVSHKEWVLLVQSTLHRRGSAEKCVLPLRPLGYHSKRITTTRLVSGSFGLLNVIEGAYKSLPAIPELGGAPTVSRSARFGVVDFQRRVFDQSAD